MRIATRLKLAGLLSVGVVAVIGAVLLSTTQQVRRELTKNELAAEVLKGVTAVKYLTLEYVLRHEERAQAQWRLRHASLSKLLTNITEFTDTKEQAIVDGLRHTHESINTLFTQLVTNHQNRENDGEKSAVLEELETRVTGQITNKTQTMISDAQGLSERSRARVLEHQQRASFAMMSFGGIVVLVIAATLFLTLRSVTRPLAKLREGTEIVGAGNLDFRLDVTARDEIGELSRAFDKMTGRLKETITERKRAEEALRESEQSLATTLNSIGDAVIATDMEGRVVRMNPVAEQLTGWSLEEAKGRSLAEVFRILNEETRRPAESPVARVLREGVVVGLANHTALISRDGTERPIADSGAPIRDSKGEISGVVLVFRDQTEERSTEEMRFKSLQLEAQNLRIQEANRLKSEFLANMSHELRTPLNGIIGFAEIMHDGKVGPVSADHKEYLGDILTSARHLLQLINDVLDLAKVESGKMEFRPEPVSSTKLITEVRTILQTLSASKRLTVETEVSPDVEHLIIDPAKLKQILYNYLSNAIKFTSEKGHITLRALADGSDFFRLEVEDTGIGIAADQIDKLFAEFQQLDGGASKRHQGTGLGLALTKKIVEAQGGRVGVQSIVGQGSVFYAVLPKIAAGKSETSPERRMIVAAATGRPNILVVEDNEQDLQWIAKILSEQGHSFDTARTGAEALAKTKATVYSVILLDLILPDMIGWDVLHSIRTEGANQHTPVIVVTVVTEKEMARGFPVQDYLIKPLSPESLVDSLKSAGVQSNGARKKVLVVDDDLNALKIARVALQSSRYDAVCHSGAKSGLAAAAESSFDAIVLDLLMPEIDGFEFLDRFRAIAGCRDTPVIVWTNKDMTAEDRERLEQSAQSIALKGRDGIDAVLRELQRHVASVAESSLFLGEMSSDR